MTAEVPGFPQPDRLTRDAAQSMLTDISTPRTFGRAIISPGIDRLTEASSLIFGDRSVIAETDTTRTLRTGEYMIMYPGMSVPGLIQRTTIFDKTTGLATVDRWEQPQGSNLPASYLTFEYTTDGFGEKVLDRAQQYIEKPDGTAVFSKEYTAQMWINNGTSVNPMGTFPLETATRPYLFSTIALRPILGPAQDLVEFWRDRFGVNNARELVQSASQWGYPDLGAALTSTRKGDVRFVTDISLWGGGARFVTINKQGHIIQSEWVGLGDQVGSHNRTTYGYDRKGRLNHEKRVFVDNETGTTQLDTESSLLYNRRDVSAPTINGDTVAIPDFTIIKGSVSGSLTGGGTITMEAPFSTADLLNPDTSAGVIRNKMALYGGQLQEDTDDHRVIFLRPRAVGDRRILVTKPHN